MNAVLRAPRLLETPAPAPSPSRLPAALGWTTLRGQRLAYRLAPGGAGLPVVGIHGLGSESSDLLEVVRLAGTSALLPDLPGFGRSGRQVRDHSVAEAARCCVALAEREGVRRALWLGCSYGAHVALRVALARPDLVAGLLLIAPGGLDPAPPAELAAFFSEERLRGRSAADVAASCDLLTGRPNAATHAFRARRLDNHQAGAASDYRAVAGAALGALADDTPRRLEEIAVPVELVLGTRDPLITQELVHTAQGRFAAARLNILEGCGHLPWLEAPARVASSLRALAARVDSPAEYRLRILQEGRQ